MASQPPRVCLSMIVKDEAHVIRRCLASVRPFIDTWVIVDTGSTDGTEDVIRDALAGIPGEVVHRPWRDFGHNRTEALELARPRADYVLVIDADEEWHAPEGFTFPGRMADGVQVRHLTHGSTSFALTTLMRSSLPWRYAGILHEVATCDAPHTIEVLEGPTIVGHFDSARNQRPQREKYLADAQVLLRGVAEEPGNERYAFYLAQSYRDAGEVDEAIAWYERRAAMPGWPEETWYAIHQVARLRERRGDPLAIVVDAYLRSHEARPVRAEPLCDLARINREAGRPAAALIFAQAAVGTERPDDRLFLDEDVYAWRSRDELSLALHLTGDHAAAVEVGAALVDDPSLPPAQRDRVRTNLAYFRQAAGRPDEAPPGAGV